MRKFAAIFLALALISPGIAFSENGVFSNYKELREQLDTLMMERKISQVLILFGGADEMTTEQLTQLEKKVRLLFPRDFTNAQMVRREKLENGWRQELLAYWTGTDYIYVYMLLHVREDQLLSINFNFDSNFHKLNAKF